MDNIVVKKVAEYRRDLKAFGKELVSLADKSGTKVPFNLNQAQTYINERIEAQKEKTGKVRVVVLKGRQQGASKYNALRCNRNSMYYPDKKTFVMAHDAATTTSLFQDLKNMYNSIPVNDRWLKPALKKNNARVLEFGDINSSVTVGTAGSAEVGRGLTIHNLWGSEVAFWQNGDKILAALFQTVPNLKGTEIILESTANGMDNMFYRLSMQAMAGEGEYELIFVPWWWTDEYQLDAPKDWEPSEDEWSYYDQYMSKDIPEDKAWGYLYWRKMKIAETSLKKFKQEYPSTPIEAFQTSGDSFFDNEAVQCAVNTNLREDTNQPLVIGVDAAGETKGDKTVFCFRRGKKIIKFLKYDEIDPMMLAGITAKIIDGYKPMRVFFDHAYGDGAVSRLKELGYRDVVKAVKFGQGAIDKEKYANKRAEMHGVAREWLYEGFNDYDPDTKQGGVDIVTGIDSMDNTFIADLSAIPEEKNTSNGKIQLIPKTKIKEDYGRSPDYADAFVLTFAEPIRYNLKKEFKVTGGLYKGE